MCYDCALYLCGQYKLKMCYTGKTSICDSLSMNGAYMQLYNLIYKITVVGMFSLRLLYLKF